MGWLRGRKSNDAGAHVAPAGASAAELERAPGAWPQDRADAAARELERVGVYVAEYVRETAKAILRGDVDPIGNGTRYAVPIRTPAGVRVVSATLPQGSTALACRVIVEQQLREALEALELEEADA
jgi:hypothetical protein